MRAVYTLFKTIATASTSMPLLHRNFDFKFKTRTKPLNVVIYQSSLVKALLASYHLNCFLYLNCFSQVYTHSIVMQCYYYTVINTIVSVGFTVDLTLHVASYKKIEEGIVLHLFKYFH